MTDARTPQKIIYLYITGFFLKFATTFSLILTSASFLKTAGAGMLPVFYIILNILSISVGTTLAVKNVKNFKLPIYASSVMGLYMLWFSAVLSGATSWDVMALYSVISIYDIYVNILFWTHINQCLTIKEIKSYVGLISGVSFFGGILAGVFNKLLLAYVTIKSAFVVCGAVHLLLPLAVFLHVEPPAGGAAFLKEGFAGMARRQISGSKLLRTIMLIFVFSSFIRYTIGFQYGAAISDQFRDEKSLAGFIGLFDSAVKISIFLSQIILAERLLKNFSFRSNLFFYQTGILFFSLALFFHRSFWLMIGFQFYFQLFVKLIEHNVAGALFNIFARDIKNQIKFMVEGMVFPLASIFIGIFITSFKGLAVQGYFFVFLSIAAVLYYISTIKLNDEYMDSIAAVLRSKSSAADDDGKISHEKPEFEEGFDIEFYLSNEREGRIDMVHELGKLPPGMTEFIIIRLLRDEKDKFVMASLVKAACGHKSEKVQQQLGRTIFSLNDNRVTANFIEAAAAGGNEDMVSYISAYIEHSDNRVRANAILAAVKLSCDEEVLKRALASLSAMARSDSARNRASSAAVMGELGLECFVGAIEKLFSDPDISVRKAALAASEKTGLPKFIPALERMKAAPGSEKLSALIDRAMARIKSGVYCKLTEVMNSFNDEDKRMVSSLVKNAADARTAETIITVLSIPPADYSLKFAEIFSKYHSDEELSKIAVEYIRAGKFPAEVLLSSMIMEGRKPEWGGAIVEALAVSNRPRLEESLLSILSDERLAKEENEGAVRICFDILGRCIDDRAKSFAIMDNARSDDPALADMALELLESVENEPLRKGFIELCGRIKSKKRI